MDFSKNADLLEIWFIITEESYPTFGDLFLQNKQSTMRSATLESVPTADVIHCLNDAFSNYFVPMPTAISFWEKRFHAARVDWSLSQGIFEKNKLVAFAIHGVDSYKGVLTAFNTGTGVVEAHRGLQLVDRMYATALSQLQTKGIKKCMLEVIQENARAIRVYERIGFSITRSLACFKGKIQLPKQPIRLEKIGFADVIKLPQRKHKLYSWDNTNVAVERFGDYALYSVKTQNETYLGYFIIEPKSGYIAQLEAENKDFLPLFNGIQQISNEIRINNIDPTRIELIKVLAKIGLQNTINQYEMEMTL